MLHLRFPSIYYTFNYIFKRSIMRIQHSKFLEQKKYSSFFKITLNLIKIKICEEFLVCFYQNNHLFLQSNHHNQQMQFVKRSLSRSFSTVKEQFNHFFIIRLFFTPDGYYQSNQFRPEFIESLNKLQKENKALVLGGDSFPFGTSTFYFNCDEPKQAINFANNNIFVKKGIASSSVEEAERISYYKFGNIVNFYQIKLNV